MRKATVYFSMAMFLVGLSLPAMALAQVSADDFMPVVQGGSAEVAQPAKVKVEEDVVTAATAQDAINTAVQENKEELKEGDTPDVGCKMAKFGSGIGYVATGAAAYGTMENPVATRIAKRKAYVIAFVQAKKNLAEMLGGLSNTGQETIREALTNINLPDEEMTNISTQSKEALTQAVDMMLRGFVIYEVVDDTDQTMIFVSIVSTPKTVGKLARPAPNAVAVETLREGIQQVLNEVRTGLVPPVGGRIIMMRSTGETAFVGFGSSVVRTSSVAAAQAKLNLQAQKIAGMRAKDALCGLIIGDRTSWEGGVVDTLQDSVQGFEEAAEDDPLAEGSGGPKKLAEARETFVSRIQSTDTFSSARKGILPPGVNAKTWFDDDKSWAYGMAVYVPSLSNAAAGHARDMRESAILKPVDDGSGRRPGGTGGTAGQGSPNISRPGDDVKRGPTGKISPDDEF